MVSVYFEKRLGYRVTEEEVALRKKCIYSISKTCNMKEIVKWCRERVYSD